MSIPRTAAVMAFFATCTPTGAPPTVAAQQIACGRRTDDWCPAPPGDPCGAHRDAASCRDDARCEAMVYRGESLEGCLLDARCFARNCPAVGCVSRCESLTRAACAQHRGRCILRGEACVRVTPCGPRPAP